MMSANIVATWNNSNNFVETCACSITKLSLGRKCDNVVLFVGNLLKLVVGAACKTLEERCFVDLRIYSKQNSLLTQH